jgi:hypothetical protein
MKKISLASKDGWCTELSLADCRASVGLIATMLVAMVGMRLAVAGVNCNTV